VPFSSDLRWPTVPRRGRGGDQLDRFVEIGQSLLEAAHLMVGLDAAPDRQMVVGIQLDR
jgi:hypothetical protein